MYGRRKGKTRTGKKNYAPPKKSNRRVVRKVKSPLPPGSTEAILSLRPKWQATVPTRLPLKLTYCDSDFSITLNAGNSYFDYYEFRGNSLYDCDKTGVGVQPYGYDQYCGPSTSALYQSYIVLASKITVYPKLKTNETLDIKMSVIPTKTGITYTDPSDLQMAKYSRIMVYNSEKLNNGQKKISHYASSRMMYKNRYDENNQSAAYNANPAATWDWVLAFTSSDGPLEVTTYFDVKIKYYSMAIEPHSTLNES